MFWYEQISVVKHVLIIKVVVETSFNKKNCKVVKTSFGVKQLTTFNLHKL